MEQISIRSQIWISRLKEVPHLAGAALNDGKETVRFLLQKGATIDIGDPSEFTIVSIHGRIGMAKLLLENGANINQLSQSRGTALHATAKNMDLEVLHFLVDNGANSIAIDAKGKTALNYSVGVWEDKFVLHMACFDGEEEVVQTLLENSANINTPRHVYKYIGPTLTYSVTPIYVASSLGHQEVIDALLELCMRAELFAGRLECDG
ncbi:ankyrin repeat-containing domain protein [Penicillium argentinense]|uniref:Ankyrin repeat-containing domain protein n=1 Tax=Penicillium argentinense TaxID=1131581 RepID=A0A9W9G1J1_9EURO|nr:ankyrin repeat-containing domain protein [Penicillium argentinense]KAJ5110424.1 ankyrin repeat-containing domain protein [Penicillium argentinense]